MPIHKLKDVKGLNFTKGKIKIILAMLIWGTIGVFVRLINLSSVEIAFARAFIGSLFLFILGILKGGRLKINDFKKNLFLLIISGGIIGVNWIFLFQGYKYTTISNATLSYYFAPIFIAIFSSIILKEKLNLRKILCILGALVGLFLILKNGDITDTSYNHIKGILYGLSGAVLYAIVVILNKQIKGIPTFNVTLIQLFMAGIVLLPFIFPENNLHTLDMKSILILSILGIIHTGIAYLLYFSGIKDVEGQSIAILSYIDPIFAVIISSVILEETMGILQIIGGVLILGSTYLSERI